MTKDIFKMSVKDLLLHIEAVEEKNRQLEIKNEILNDELENIKKMSMFEFGNKYCSDESLKADGKTFAKALLGGI